MARAWHIARVKKQYLCIGNFVVYMSIKSIIGLLAGVVGIYWYKQDLEAEYQERQKEQQRQMQALLDDIAERDKIINPNGSTNQPPVTIVGEVTMGGLTLNMLEIVLVLKNYGSVQVELKDWFCELSVGGIVSGRVFPANLSGVIIPAGQTREFRLYARGDEAFPGVYGTVKSSLAAMLGQDKIKANTYIPATDSPAELDIQVLWDVEGNEREVQMFNVPCSFSWPFAGWTVGLWTGYNAGKEKQQAKNPSHWMP